jgi:hypothetical protein
MQLDVVSLMHHLLAMIEYVHEYDVHVLLGEIQEILVEER